MSLQWSLRPLALFNPDSPLQIDTSLCLISLQWRYGFRFYTRPGYDLFELNWLRAPSVTVKQHGYVNNACATPLLTTRESTPVFSYMNFTYVGVHACSLLVVSKRLHLDSYIRSMIWSLHEFRRLQLQEDGPLQILFGGVWDICSFNQCKQKPW